MSLFPRGFQQEFSPLFRLMDDYAAFTREGFPGVAKSLRSFQPKFDVSETKESYTLHGELPGIDQKDVSIEWTEGNTLTISGRSEHRHESEPESPKPIAEPQSQQPSVEDEADATKPAEVAAADEAKEVQKLSESPKYWVSERSVGEFSRSFSFPTRIDQDDVKASLRNGVLEINVPKATKQANRKVAIE